MRKIEIARAKKALPKPVQMFDYLVIGLTAALPVLYKRIDQRVDERLRQGMEGEVETLVAKYGRDIPAMSALGYRSLERWKLDEHAYARRQLTWFRKVKDIRWFDITEAQWKRKVEALVRAWYT